VSVGGRAPSPLPLSLEGRGGKRHSRGGGNPGWLAIPRTSSEAAGHSPARERAEEIAMTVVRGIKPCRNDACEPRGDCFVAVEGGGGVRGRSAPRNDKCSGSWREYNPLAPCGKGELWSASAVDAGKICECWRQRTLTPAPLPKGEGGKWRKRGWRTSGIRGHTPSRARGVGGRSGVAAESEMEMMAALVGRARSTPLD